MRFLRSKELIDDWCRARGSLRRPSVTMDQFWQLAVTWHATRLEPDSRRPTAASSLFREAPPDCIFNGRHPDTSVGTLSSSRRIFMFAFTLLALAGRLAVPAPDTTVNGVTFTDTVTVAGQSLVLNGVALRKKAIFKVYEAGLYLSAKSSDADAILAADTPRRMVMQFLRDVGKDKMCEAWNEALENNTPDASAELKTDFTTLCGYMEDIKDKQQFVFTYVPGTGTEVSVAGAVKGTIAGKEFADALFKAWIGPKPGPGEGFKKNLLGAK